MARYLVTGGCGFIGSHICEALIAENHQVYVLDNLSSGKLDNLAKEAEFIKGDVRDYALVKNILAEVDGCFHLAAMVSVTTCNEDLLNAHQVNLSGTLNVLESAYSHKKGKGPVPVVFASSAAVYGDNQNLPLTESEKTSPISIYGVNKFCCEQYAKVINSLYGVPVTALRLFNVYGPRQNLHSNYSGVINLFWHNLTKDLPLIIYGDGKQTRDFIYVKDVAKFFLIAMKNSSHAMKIYNVCTGKAATIKEIAILLGDLLKKKPQILFKEKKLGDIYHSLGAPILIYRELGLKAETMLEVGLKLLIEQSDTLN